MTAMEGGEPDRVPCALGFYRVEIEGMVPEDGFSPDWIDIRFIDFTPSAEERRLRRAAQPHSGDTRLGSQTQIETYRQWGYHPHHRHQRNPLARVRSLDELKAFPFPEPPDHWADPDLGRRVRAIHARGCAAGGNLPHLGGELFEAAWRLRGLENFLLDLLERPEWAHFVLDRLAELAKANAVALAAAGVDVLALDDDVGMPRGMMISPRTWREFFKPRMAEIVRAAREKAPALKVLYHSDGYFEPIVEDLIEIGVDAINPIQPDHMDAVHLRRRFGRRVALWGTVGSQITFSFATPRQICQEVKDRIAQLGRWGLVLSPAYDVDEPDIPWENVVAFLQAVREFG